MKEDRLSSLALIYIHKKVEKKVHDVDFWIQFVDFTPLNIYPIVLSFFKIGKVTYFCYKKKRKKKHFQKIMQEKIRLEFWKKAVSSCIMMFHLFWNCWVVIFSRSNFLREGSYR